MRYQLVILWMLLFGGSPPVMADGDHDHSDELKSAKKSARKRAKKQNTHAASSKWSLTGGLGVNSSSVIQDSRNGNDESSSTGLLDEGHSHGGDSETTESSPESDNSFTPFASIGAFYNLNFATVGVSETVALKSPSLSDPSLSIANNFSISSDWTISSTVFATAPISSSSKKSGKITQFGGSIGPKQRFGKWSLSASVGGGICLYKSSSTASTQSNDLKSREDEPHIATSSITSNDFSRHDHKMSLLDEGHDHSTSAEDAGAGSQSRERRRIGAKLGIGYALHKSFRLDSSIGVNQVTMVDSSAKVLLDATVVQATYSYSP